MNRLVLVTLALTACAHAGGLPDLASCPQRIQITPTADPARIDYACARATQAANREKDALANIEAAGRALAEARTARDRAALDDVAIELLTLDPTDIEAHLERARALHAIEPTTATWHETVARGLLTSLLSPGAGTDQAHPVRVVSAREQQAVLAFLDIQVTHRRSLAGRQIIEGTTRGRPTTIWFELQCSPGASCPDRATYSR